MMFRKLFTALSFLSLSGAKLSSRSSCSAGTARQLAECDFLTAADEPLGVLRAFESHLEICAAAGQVDAVEWADFFTAAWDSAARTLRLQLVDPKLPVLVLELPEKYSELFLQVVRERIEFSLVYQVATALPSGIKVQGLVRRNADGTLFTQMFHEGLVESEADRAALAVFEAELRETAGL